MMDWLAQNWLWVLVFVIFIGLHLFGHGGHGGHGGGHGRHRPSDKGNAKVDKSQGHQH